MRLSIIEEKLLISADPRRTHERAARSAANRNHSVDTGRFFENEVWLLLDRMGFEGLNPQGFKLDATPEGYGPQTRQIDVFAKWQKEVLVIECKASDQERVGLNRRDLSDFHEKMPRLTRAVHSAYGRDVRVNFAIWLKGITPIRRDLEDIARYHMSLFDYGNLQSYQKATRLIGAAAKFQLLADLYGPRARSRRGSSKTPARSGPLGGWDSDHLLSNPQTGPLAAHVARHIAELKRRRIRSARSSKQGLTPAARTLPLERKARRSPQQDPDLDVIFAALAHPIRRSMLEQLAGGDASVTDLAKPHKVSLPAISRHLRVLEDAGLIEVAPEGRVHRVQLYAAPLGAAFGWLTRYRVMWEDRFDRLAEHIERRAKKPKARRIRRNL